MRTRARVTCSLSILFSVLWSACGGQATAPSTPDAGTYVAEIESWREDRVARLRSETGWLSLIGLYWLEPGEAPFGSDPSNAIVIPDPEVPPVAGRLVYDGERVRIASPPGSGVLVGGQPVVDKELADDGDGDPDVVQVGRVSFYVIERIGLHAVRVRDPESPTRASFTGIDFYPVEAALRVDASFTAYEEPEEVRVATVVGTPTRMFVPGRIEFWFEGRSHSLRPLVEDPDDISGLIIFKDLTSESETYEAGRYLSVELDGDRVELDFNRAYNPPCAFTPYATCPLPPRENHLEVAIRAGERRYEGAEHP